MTCLRVRPGIREAALSEDDLFNRRSNLIVGAAIRYGMRGWSVSTRPVKTSARRIRDNLAA